MSLRLAAVFAACCWVPLTGYAGPRVGVLLKDRLPGFWVYAEQGAVETGEQLGAEVIVKAPPSVLDVGFQPRLLAALATQNLDALVVAPTNPDAVEAMVRELAGKGVKIVTLDTPFKDGVADVFVGADQAVIAAAAAQVFLELAKDGDEVALLRNNSLDRPVLLREQALRQAVQSRSGLVLHADVFASSEKNQEDQQAQLLLTQHPKIKAVFASATRGTLSTIRAIRQSGLVGKVKVVGFGTYLPDEAAQAFEDGILHGWVAQEPKDLGVQGVRAAVALAKGESVPAVVRPAFVLVTSDNFRSPEVQALRKP
ncbi:sugar ABC transporter substrate-binding protein [Opitutus terrae]|nr:substrate-binding domain-containing protein [Opitutus terrae]